MSDVRGTGSSVVSTTVVGLQGRPVASTAPATNQVLQFSGTQWQPATIAAGGLTIPNSPLLGGTGTAFSAVAVGTGLSLTGGTLSATGGTGTGTVTSITAAAPLTGGTITTTGTIGLGNVPVSNLNGGTGASATTFWRGDGIWAAPAGGGNVTTTTLTVSALTVGTGATAIGSLASLGTTTTVLHGNAAGLPSFGAVTLTSDVAGILPVANGGTGSSTAGSGVTQVTASTGITLTPNPITGTGSVALTVPVVVANGGTGATTLTANGVLLGNATSAIGATAAGTTGQVLTGVTGAAPTWQTPTGVTTSTALVNNQLVLGTAASTVAPLAPGTSGQYLQSNGTGNAPTWVTLTAGSGTVTASPQYQVAFYPAAGSVATVQGSTNISTAAAGGLTLGAPTDGNLGASTFNAAGLIQSNVSTATGANVAAIANTLIHFAGADAASPRILGTGFGVPPVITLRAASGTGATPAASAANLTLGSLVWTGYGTAWLTTAVARAQMAAFAGELWSGTAQGTYLTASTTQNTTTTLTERLRLVQGLLVDGAAGVLPTGGDMGAGTINVAAGYYLSGVSITVDSLTGGITAAGTTQATGTALTTQFNVVTTTAVGTGVVLPAGIAGAHCLVRNSGANPLLVYPAAGAAINAQAVNTAISVVANTTAYFECQSATQWFSVP